MTTATDQITVRPDRVREILSRHMLADGLDLVLDLEKSHGVWLHDSQRDREFLDFFTSFSSYPLGFNHPKMLGEEFREKLLRAAIVKPSNADLYTVEMADFVETFSRIVPERYSRRLFFVSGGALAVENALKTAFDWKIRKNIAAGRGKKGRQVIHFEKAFHGRSGYTLSLTNTADPRKTQYFPKFQWPRVSTPALRFPVTDEVLEETRQSEARSLDEVRRALAENPHDVAAIIIEPIQGEGGDNHFRGEFLRALRQIADEEEVLLVFDEIQTGFGTTGKWWCFEHFDVEPDIFAFGKKTQVCGIAATERIDEVDSVFKVSSRINSTWGGNLVDMIRCQRFVEIIEEDRLLDSVRDVGATFLARLEELGNQIPELDNVRGRGMFLAFDLPSTEERDALLRGLADNDLLALPSGTRSIRFRPPLILRPKHVDEGIRRLRRALESV